MAKYKYIEELVSKILIPNILPPQIRIEINVQIEAFEAFRETIPKIMQYTTSVGG